MHIFTEKNLMFARFTLFTKRVINERPLAAIAITSTGSFIGGCVVTSYYMRPLIKRLENQLAKQSAKIPPDDSDKGKLKRAVNVITDEAVEYVTRQAEDSVLFKTGRKLRNIVESKNDDAKADSEKQNEKSNKLEK